MRRIILNLIITLTIFTCTGCNYVKDSSYISSTHSVASTNGVPSANSEFSSADKTANVVYDVYGVSNKLSSNSVESMQRWRDEAKAYGEEYPDVVLLNDQPQSNTVYLTFDDGPDNTITPQIVDILAENNVCGNFFFIGEKIKDFEDIVKKAYANKNFVGSHCFTHTKLTAMSSVQVKKELTDTNNILKSITGVTPSFARPPYGDINDNVISDFKDLNLKMVLWSIDTLDWSQRDAIHITKNVSEYLRPGDIILMHCNSDKTETVKALPEVIQAIKDKGYKMGTFYQFTQ